LKPDVVSFRRRSKEADRPAYLLAKDAGTLLVRSIEPNSIASHDWHVQPICQRSLRMIRLSGIPWIEVRICIRLSSNLVRIASFFPLAQRTSAFLREPFKVIKTSASGQPSIPPEPLWITRFALR